MTGKWIHAVLVSNPAYYAAGDWGLKEGLLDLTARDKYTFSAIALIDPQLLQGQVINHKSITELFLPVIQQSLASGELYTGVYHNVGTVAEYEALNKL